MPKLEEWCEFNPLQKFQMFVLGGDQITHYEANWEGSFSDFKREVLALKSEWGKVRFKSKVLFEYKYGEITKVCNSIPEDQIVKLVRIETGWSRSDYSID